MADVPPADARPPNLLPDDEPAAVRPPPGVAPVERVGGVRVVPAGGDHAAVAAALLAAPAHPAGGPLVGGAAQAFEAAPAAGAAALKGHDDEVKALHGGHHDPTHSKGGSKGVEQGISGANKVMDSRRTHYGVPQGRRTGGH